MRVTANASAVREFRRRARKAAPNEIIAALVGIHDAESSHAMVRAIAYPKISSCSPNHAEVDDSEFEQIDRVAKKTGYRVIGSIHSHPNWPAVCSPTDFELFEKDLIVGILEVPTNTRKPGHLFFWHKASPLRCEVEYL